MNVTTSVRLGRTELLFFFLRSKSRDLGPGQGFRVGSFKNKGKQLDFHIFGVKKTTNSSKQIDEIGQMLVSGALDRPKKIRKTAADILAKSGFEKTGKPRANHGKIRGLFYGFQFFQGFPGPDFAKISAAVLRIFLVRSRAPGAKI